MAGEGNPEQRHHRLLLDTIFLGVVGALGVQLFMWTLRVAQALLLSGIAGDSPPGLPAEGSVLGETIGPLGVWLIPIATTLGGLLQNNRFPANGIQ